MGRGPMTQSTWLGSLIFDGARAVEGVIPDIELHCARACDSARRMLMEPKIRPEEMVELVKDAVGRFPAGTALYIKPMFWADSGWIYPDPASTRFLLNVFESPLPDGKGFSAHVSTRRRPARSEEPTSEIQSLMRTSY